MDNIYLGIEFGSTRIKACLIDDGYNVIAKGDYDWENKFENGYWTYSLDDIKKGLKGSFKALKEDYKNKFGKALTSVSSIGISGMMHGFLAFDKEGNLLTPFRTWRNTVTGRAAKILSEKFSFNVPQRWSIAHLYEAVLNDEPYIKDIAHITTLAGYIHFLLTGERKMGVGEASGMFPIENGNYNKKMLDTFRSLVKDKVPWDILDILPTVKTAGENCGTLTDEGAAFIDEDGEFKAGIPFCAPEGDAGTGMVATNSVTPKTANVSAGTSGFLMAVLEKDLDGYYREIDVVTTPHGAPVAMVHANNFTSEMNAWTNLFEEVIGVCGAKIDRGELFGALYRKSKEADAECGGIVGFNFLAGEPIAEVSRGIPMIARMPEGKLTLANFMKMHIYSALGPLAMGCEILAKEKVEIKSVCGHGGFFKTPVVGQSAMSAAIGAPVTVMQNAAEGGAWGIAILALFTYLGENDLESFLDGIFESFEKTTLCADEEEVKSFNSFMNKYKKALAVERHAGEIL